MASSCVAGLPPEIGGRWSELKLSHRPADLLRAVVEGLAFELNRYLGFLRKAGWPVARLVLGGGAAASDTTRGILADTTGLPLTCSGSSEASLLGAAILARGLVEPTASLADLAESMLPPARHVEPGAHSAGYAGRYQRYLDSLPLPPAPLS
jgi:sugar (pentulose or hexulose) kinase